jgi:hypothetical protein
MLLTFWIILATDFPGDDKESHTVERQEILNSAIKGFGNCKIICARYHRRNVKDISGVVSCANVLILAKRSGIPLDVLHKFKADLETMVQAKME